MPKQKQNSFVRYALNLNNIRILKRCEIDEDQRRLTMYMVNTAKYRKLLIMPPLALVSAAIIFSIFFTLPGVYLLSAPVMAAYIIIGVIKAIVISAIVHRLFAFGVWLMQVQNRMELAPAGMVAEINTGYKEIDAAAAAAARDADANAVASVNVNDDAVSTSDVDTTHATNNDIYIPTTVQPKASFKSKIIDLCYALLFYTNLAIVKLAFPYLSQNKIHRLNSVKFDSFAHIQNKFISEKCKTEKPAHKLALLITVSNAAILLNKKYSIRTRTRDSVSHQDIIQDYRNIRKSGVKELFLKAIVPTAVAIIFTVLMATFALSSLGIHVSMASVVILYLKGFVIGNFLVSPIVLKITSLIGNIFDQCKILDHDDYAHMLNQTCYLRHTVTSNSLADVETTSTAIPTTTLNVAALESPIEDETTPLLQAHKPEPLPAGMPNTHDKCNAYYKDSFIVETKKSRYSRTITVMSATGINARNFYIQT